MGLPLSGHAQLQKGKQRHDDKEHNRLGLTHPLPAAAAVKGIINIQRQQLRLLLRGSAGERQILVKHLKGICKGQKSANGHRRHHQRQLDAKQSLRSGCAVNGRRLQKIVRHILQRRNIDHHHIADQLPVGQRHQSPKAVGGLIGNIHPRPVQHTVNEQIPNISQHNPADQIRHKEHAAKEIGAPQSPGKKQCQCKGKHIHCDDTHAGEQRRKPQRVEKAAVCSKGLHIVLQSYPRGVRHRPESGKGKPYPQYKGRRKGKEKGHRRGQ